MKERWGLIWVDMIFLIYWGYISLAISSSAYIIRGMSIWQADPFWLYVACLAGSAVFAVGCWIINLLHKRKRFIYWLVTAILIIPFLCLFACCCVLPFKSTPFHTSNEILRNCIIALIVMGTPVLYMLRPSIRKEFTSQPTP